MKNSLILAVAAGDEIFQPFLLTCSAPSNLPRLSLGAPCRPHSARPARTATSFLVSARTLPTVARRCCRRATREV